MNIIIPMSGVGRRFREAGYKAPKFLIEVERKTVIEHVIERFETNDHFIFILNETDFQNKNLIHLLENKCPGCDIIPIPLHKLGPVYAVLQASSLISDNEPYIVNYCDFSWRWNYENFKEELKSKNPDGCLVAYKGFHPHLLPKENFYAGIKADSNNLMEEIREKYSYAENKMECYQSSGTYYFKTGGILKKYFKKLMDEKISLNGEYYVSMVYNLLCHDKLQTLIYKIPYMLQWGTPQDLEEYLYWSRYFKQQ